MDNVIKFSGDKDLEKYFKIFEELESIYPRIAERRANLTLAGIDARTYNHWRNSGLVGEIPKKGEKRAWIKMNLYDYTWLRLVAFMRDFGVPFSTIKELREMMTLNLLKSLSSQLNEVEKFLREESNLSEETIDEYIRLIKIGIKNIDSVPEEDQSATTIIAGLIHRVLLMDDEAYIVIKKSKDEFSFGYYTFQTMDEFSKHVTPLIGTAHLNIPIKSFIQEFMEEEDNEQNLSVWGFINKNERKVLDAIREKDFKEILIKKDKKTNALILEGTMDGDILEEKAKEVRRLLGMNQYSEVTVKFRNDNHLYFKSRKRL